MRVSAQNTSNNLLYGEGFARLKPYLAVILKERKRLKNMMVSFAILRMTQKTENWRAMDKATVTKVATLARIRVKDAELEQLVPQFNGLLKWIEQLSEVTTDGVEPLPSPVDIALPLREDILTDGGCAKEILANAPEEASGYFVVPKVIE